GDVVHGEVARLSSADLGDHREAFDAVDRVTTETGAEMVCVIEEGRLAGTLSQRSALRGSIYRPALDAAGRLAVAVAIGINGDVAGKTRALTDAGADVLVIDTAHGHQETMLRALGAAQVTDLPIVAGNVV